MSKRIDTWLPATELGSRVVAIDANTLLSALASHGAAVLAPQKPQRTSQQTRTKKFLRDAFPPDGLPPIHWTLHRIQKRLEIHFKRNGLKLASTDTIARALGRRSPRR